ncbi:hypothetical protein DFH01_25525 [Falsiroseomonas bella]|uniref:Uncharacterized protein n=1 Tax=Falsiroseomonas bella TaxID=2184016 RepID=A0A317F5G6_9PROT|nr:hypothetical protein [Falsiroseomonas bella]PWS34380.1 hypothetical protein DFH01_25525 [Falsiroseomonas bella]
MTTKRITVFRAGVFSTEPHPPWMEAVHAAEVEREDYDAALDLVLGQRTSHTAVNGVAWPAAEVITRRTPDGGYFVDMMAEEYSHAEVWIPDPADWLPFHVGYVEPFLMTHATIRRNDCLDRLTNALIAFARHGEGRHIDRLTGESRIDEREDEERRKRSAAARSRTTSN